MADADGRGRVGRRGVVAAGLALTLSAVSGCGGAPTTAPVTATKAVVSATPKTVAIVRLSDPTTFAEPKDEDIQAGLDIAGYSPKVVTFKTFDAKGDPGALAARVDEAVKAAPDAILAVGSAAARAAAGKAGKIPVVFSLVGDPPLLGLAKNEADHGETVTGVYTNVQKLLTVPIARGTQRNPPTMGVLFHPEDPISVAYKDALLNTEWGPVKPVVGEYHADSEIPAAVRSLVDKKVSALLLTDGIGLGAKAAIEEATRAKIPTFGFVADHPRYGAVVARTPQTRWAGFEAGRVLARVLQGESPKGIKLRPGDQHDLWVNMDAAKAINVTIFGQILRDPKKVSTGDPTDAAKAAAAASKSSK